MDHIFVVNIPVLKPWAGSIQRLFSNRPHPIRHFLTVPQTARDTSKHLPDLWVSCKLKIHMWVIHIYFYFLIQMKSRNCYTFYSIKHYTAISEVFKQFRVNKFFKIKFAKYNFWKILADQEIRDEEWINFQVFHCFERKHCFLKHRPSVNSIATLQ